MYGDLAAKRTVQVVLVTSPNVGAAFNGSGSLQIRDDWFHDTISFSHILPPSLDGLEFSCSIYLNKSRDFDQRLKYYIKRNIYFPNKSIPLVSLT